MWPVAEQNVHYWRYKSIDKKRENIWRDIFVLLNTFKIVYNYNIFDKGGEKLEQTEDFKQHFFFYDILMRQKTQCRAA